MKSMLHEASSIVKAIEKAWINSGKPLEFTVKILEEGEKNFLGMTKRPAIVSVTCDPRGKTCGARAKVEVKPMTQGKDAHRNTMPDRRTPRRSEDRFAQPKKDASFQDRRTNDASNRPTNIQQQTKKFEPEKGVALEQNREREDECVWNDAFMQDARESISELMNVMQITTPFSLKSDDGKGLKVIFTGPLGVKEEDARALFASLSYLVIQFLKKKYRKRFPGFHLIISSQEHATNNKTNG